MLQGAHWRVCHDHAKLAQHGHVKRPDVDLQPLGLRQSLHRTALSASLQIALPQPRSARAVEVRGEPRGNAPHLQILWHSLLDRFGDQGTIHHVGLVSIVIQLVVHIAARLHMAARIQVAAVAQEQVRPVEDQAPEVQALAREWNPVDSAWPWSSSVTVATPIVAEHRAVALRQVAITDASCAEIFYKQTQCQAGGGVSSLLPLTCCSRLW